MTGIDIFAPSLDLARANVQAAGLDGRVELLMQDAADLPENPQLRRDLAAAAVPAGRDHRAGDRRRGYRALRPGGWLLPGTFIGPGDRLSQLLNDLRIVRSGGHPWRPQEVTGMLTAAGFAGAQEIPRSWAAPVRLWAGQRG